MQIKFNIQIMGDSSEFQQIVQGGIGPVLQFCMFCISWAGEIYSFSGGVKCKLVSRLLEKCKLTWADRGFWGSEFCIWMRYESYKLLTSCRGLRNLNAEDSIMQYDGNDVNLRRDLYLTRNRRVNNSPIPRISRNVSTTCNLCRETFPHQTTKLHWKKVHLG